MGKVTPKRRGVKKKPTNDEMLDNLLSGDSIVSERGRAKLDKMSENDDSKINEFEDDPLFGEKYTLDSVLLGLIVPQADNPRFLPIKNTNGLSEEEVKALKDCVVCEKGILENHLDDAHPRFQEVNDELEEIKNLAKNIKLNGLVQPIVIWKQSTSRYPILAGHRRYYAIRFLYGAGYKIRCKLYFEEPQKKQVKRYAENFLRSNLKPSDALVNYVEAMKEIASEVDLARTADVRIATVSDYLGISRAVYYRYETLKPYVDELKAVFDNQLITSIEKASEVIGSIKKADKSKASENVTSYLKHIEETNQFIEPDVFLGQSERSKDKPAPKKGRAKKYITLPKLGVQHAQGLKTLVNEGIQSVDCGVDWEQLDFDDVKAVENAFAKLFKALQK